jgi:hypothetical protein
MEVDCRVPRIVAGGRGAPPPVPALEALLPRPRLDQCAVDGEVFLRQQLVPLGLPEHRLEEALSDVACHEPLPILRKHGHVPRRGIELEAHEPAEQQVVIQLLHELALAADRVEHLEQERPEQLLGRDRGPAPLGVQRIEAARERAERPVHELADRAQRMIPGDAGLSREVAEQAALLPVLTTHEWAPWFGSRQYRKRDRRSKHTFSAAC